MRHSIRFRKSQNQNLIPLHTSHTTVADESETSRLDNNREGFIVTCAAERRKKRKKKKSEPENNSIKDSKKKDLEIRPDVDN